MKWVENFDGIDIMEHDGIYFVESCLGHQVRADYPEMLETMIYYGLITTDEVGRIHLSSEETWERDVVSFCK